jgi:hypothetical protein
VFDEDQSASLPTLDLDTLYTDPDSSTLVYTILTNLPNGKVGATITGSVLSFSPVPDENGTATIEISASDGSNTAADNTTVNVQINPVNDPPVTDQPLPKVLIGEDATSPPAADLTNGFTDIDGDTLTLVSISPTGVFNAAISGSSVTFSTIPDQVGTATVVVEAIDGGTVGVQASFQVEVTPSPDAPRVAVPIPDQVMDEDDPALSFNLDNVFEDVDGEPLSYRVTSNTLATVLTATVFDSVHRGHGRHPYG